MPSSTLKFLDLSGKMTIKDMQKAADRLVEEMAEARPLDIAHTVDTATVDDLLMEIMEDPPVLPQTPEAYAEPIQVDGSTKEV